MVILYDNPSLASESMGTFVMCIAVERFCYIWWLCMYKYIHLESTFFSDVWVYNLSQNSWYEVKFSETNSKPSERSNSSFIYSELRK